MFLLWRGGDGKRGDWWSGFNPLYWGVLIVTLRLLDRCREVVSFNPHYWGVLIVTPQSMVICMREELFQSSLLRCSYCDSKAASPTTSGRKGFQSSLLRCSYCDGYWGGGSGEGTNVSILFTEVFLLWLLTSKRSSVPSLRFNPLYWGVLIVTENGVWCGKRPTGFNPHYWGVLIVTRPLTRRSSGRRRFNPLYWGVLIVT